MSLKNRGAVSNPDGRFEIHSREFYEDGWHGDETLSSLETVLYPEQAKRIISYNDSPDIGFDQSINPYRGCEHGCIYCYARPAHSYVNLSPGLDFETKIFYKVHAAERLVQTFNKKNYRCRIIMLGANTDPYQPAEARLKITRSLLEVFLAYKHPVVIITKSALIERDLDLILALVTQNLVSVAVSLTTLQMNLKKTLEPRTATPNARLRVIRHLSEQGVPVRVMVAPIIPTINDMELEKILQQAATAGAQRAAYILIRLPHEVKQLFREWLELHYPQRAKHVMSLIHQMRNGKDYDATFGQRMRGRGEFATLLAKRFALACKRFGLNTSPARPLTTQLFQVPLAPTQLDLFSDSSDL